MFINIKTFFKVVIGFVFLILGIILLIPVGPILWVAKRLFFAIISILYFGSVVFLYGLGATEQDVQSIRDNYHTIVNKI